MREDPPPPEAVAERAADQDQRREEERVGLDDPLHLGAPSRPGRACSAGSATLTTVPSMKAMLEPRIVAASTQPPTAGAANATAPPVPRE